MSFIKDTKAFVSLALQAFARTWLGLRLFVVKLIAKIHGAISALVLIFAMSSESVMHALNIPHVEGWWLTLVGGGAVATSLSIWFHKYKTRTDP